MNHGSQTRLLLALHEVEDPELFINIVDLGLVMGIQHESGVVDLKITFTAMGCPAMDMIVEDIQERLMREPDVEQVRIEVVWHPGWSKDRLSEAGKAQMREMGVSV